MGAAGDGVLQVGRSYVFVTNRDEARGWLTVVAPGFGSVRLPDDPVGRGEVIAQFARAITEQTLPGQEPSRPGESPAEELPAEAGPPAAPVGSEER